MIQHHEKRTKGPLNIVVVVVLLCMLTKVQVLHNRNDGLVAVEAFSLFFGSLHHHNNLHNIINTNLLKGTSLKAVIDDSYNKQDDENHDSGIDDNSITPSQLESLLQNSRSSYTSRSSNNDNDYNNDDTTVNSSDRLRPATDDEIDAAEKLSGNVAVPKTGISISDEMTSIQSKENFASRLFPLDVKSETERQDDNNDDNNDDNDDDNDERDKNVVIQSHTPVVAAIQTVATGSIGDEQMRYIVALDQYNEVSSTSTTTTQQQRHYAMIDVPPFSKDLVQQIKDFMNSSSKQTTTTTTTTTTEEKGKLSYILITCRDGIHYDESPAIYVTRKSDLIKWKQAFQDVEIIMYRLDTPRDCKDIITQSLDGYGPWALGIHNDDEEMMFVETGRPLTRMEWDDEIQTKVLDNGELPPDDDDTENNSNKESDENDNDDEDSKYLYTPQAIKKREENKNILAVYTPGHTFGSVSYIFPKVNVCCSGYTIPVEDNRSSANVVGLSTAGPALDYRGYITTNSGGITRQIESARALVQTYGDRFGVLLPSRGPPVTLSHMPLVDRQRILNEMLDEYAELGRIYESMGVI